MYHAPVKVLGRVLCPGCQQVRDFTLIMRGDHLELQGVVLPIKNEWAKSLRQKGFPALCVECHGDPSEMDPLAKFEVVSS